MVDDEESGDEDVGSEDTREQVVQLSSGSAEQPRVATELDPVEETPTSKKARVEFGPSVADVLEGRHKAQAGQSGGGGSSSRRAAGGGSGGGVQTGKGKAGMKGGM